MSFFGGGIELISYDGFIDYNLENEQVAMKQPCPTETSEAQDVMMDVVESATTECEDDVASLGKRLSLLIRNKKKLSSKKGRILLLSGGNSSDDELDSDSFSLATQFFVQDLQRVVLFSTIGDTYRFYPRWCKVIRPAALKSINMITINNVSEYDYRVHRSKFAKLDKLFTNKDNNLNSIEFVSSHANGVRFYDEFVNVPITRTQWMKIRDEDEFQMKRNQVAEQYRQIYTKHKAAAAAATLDDSQTKASTQSASTSNMDAIPRTSLLLSPAQLIREDYPVPFDESTAHQTVDYVFTKSEYAAVSDASPLYAIDCEMCYNIDGEMEIVWLAMVNERLECIYETFVSPKKKINNYLTHITGVSAKTLDGVQVQLEDVQAKLSSLLSSDAILCGQSLNNDLHALKMFHPYIIDTSIVYNLSGSRDIKPSLKQLTAQFLGKMIQESSHNPATDARASIELVLLKLRNGIEFGDCIVNGCTNVFSSSSSTSADEGDFHVKVDLEAMASSMSDPFAISKFIYHTGLNIKQNFFNILRDNKHTNVFIDAKRAPSCGGLPKSCNLVHADSNERAFESAKESLNKHKFAWTQFYVSDSAHTDQATMKQLEAEEARAVDLRELKRVLKYVRRLHALMNDDSVLMLVLAGREGGVRSGVRDPADLRGRCFIAHKCSELDALEAQVAELYARVKSTTSTTTTNESKQQQQQQQTT